MHAMLKMMPAVMVLYLLASVPCNAGDPPDPRNFHFHGTIPGPLRGNALYKVRLSHAVLDTCSVGCKDLRIFGADNREVPYVIVENRSDSRQQETYPLEITGYEEKADSAVVTMKMPEKFDPVSKLVLDIPDKDFSRAVILEGSHDMNTWLVVAYDTLYDFTSRVALRKTELSFPASGFRYYRLTVREEKKALESRKTIALKYQDLDFSVSGKQEKKLRIDRVSGRTFSETTESAVYDKHRLRTYSVEQDRDGNTVISFETGLPFTMISFDVSNPYFYRKVSLYGGETDKEGSYTLLQQGTLYRFLLSEQTESRNSFDCRAAGQRFYRIVIQNGSNPPLEIRDITLSWVQKLLMFVALGDAPSYEVSSGNPYMEKPAYDLEGSINSSSWHKFSPETADITGIEQNPSYTPGIPGDRKTKREKALLTAVIITLVAGIGYWLFSLLANAGKRPGSPDRGNG